MTRRRRLFQAPRGLITDQGWNSCDGGNEMNLWLGSFGEAIEWGYLHWSPRSTLIANAGSSQAIGNKRHWALIVSGNSYFQGNFWILNSFICDFERANIFWLQCDTWAVTSKKYDEEEEEVEKLGEKEEYWQKLGLPPHKPLHAMCSSLSLVYSPLNDVTSQVLVV